MNKKSVNIICLYWVGEFRGRDFTTEDVERLRSSVAKHIDRPYKFYCLTNDMNAVMSAEKIKLKYAWPGWWSKMELHRPDLPPGRTLYMDLDSHVIRNLGPVLDYPGNLVMFKTQAPKRRVNRAIRKFDEEGWVYRYQAATMLFDPGVMSWMYNKFLIDPDFYMSRYRSDQDVMGDWITKQPTFPDKWMIKLSACLDLSEAPKEVIIVTGQPKNGEFRQIKQKAEWVEEMARGGELCM